MGCWITSRSGWLLELLTELIKKYGTLDKYCAVDVVTRIANSFSDNRRFSSRRIIFIQKYPRNFTSSLQQLKVHLPQPNIKFLRLIPNNPLDSRVPQKCYVNSTFLQTHLIKVNEYRSLAKETSLIKADKEVKKVSWS